MSEKHFPIDPRGQLDAGSSRESRSPKPCANRITHENVSRFETSVTWCTQPEGHAGQCSGPLPSILEPNDLGPLGAKRRRW